MWKTLNSASNKGFTELVYVGKYVTIFFTVEILVNLA